MLTQIYETLKIKKESELIGTLLFSFISDVKQIRRRRTFLDERISQIKVLGTNTEF